MNPSPSHTAVWACNHETSCAFTWIMDEPASTWSCRTTGSSAPFIGLFGTVWGIMTAFLGLSASHTSSIQAVAPGIAEALITTAVGLVAAIPSQMFYNYFTARIRVLATEMDNFTSEFLNIAERHFLS